MNKPRHKELHRSVHRLLWDLFFCAVFSLPRLLTPNLLAQDQKPPELPAGVLVEQTVAHEVAASNDESKHMFRERKQAPKGTQTILYVETTEAMAGMLIAENDQPLTPERQRAEDGHLQWLMDNPDQLRKKHAREKEDADRTLRIVKALPSAFLYEYAGAEANNGSGESGEPLLRLHFKPNPNYLPPSREEQVLTAMQGYLLIDAKAKRLAQIEGTLFRDVTFGWGLIGRLDKGGHFLVKQAEQGDHSWQITEMDLNLTGRILLFKSLHEISHETFSDFHPVPSDTTFARGVELLKTERAKLAPTGTSQPVQLQPAPH
jgi:hypothetical protein